MRAHEACSAAPPVVAGADSEDDDVEADARTGGGEAPADRATLPVCINIYDFIRLLVDENYFILL